MKLRYMIEFELRGRIGSPHYVPIGAWVQGSGPGIDLVIRFRPGHEKALAEAEKVLDRLEENGMRALPDGFLQYHQQTISPHWGMRGEVQQTDEFGSAAACAQSLLRQIVAGRIA